MIDMKNLDRGWISVRWILDKQVSRISNKQIKYKKGNIK